MAPEIIEPSKFGLERSVPTQEGDIYAFGLVILQVIAVCHHHLVVFFLTFCQVQTGERPFRNIKFLELAYHVSSGVRPEKPANAEAIGISNSLWKLLQRCWDGDKTQRPQIREVVAGVGSVADNWHADMPPSVVDHLEDPSEEDSDELKHGTSLSVLCRLFLDPRYSWDI